MALAKVTDAQKNAYNAKMLPVAKAVAKSAGIKESYAPLFVAWWSWETNYGTNSTAKVNNHAGITKGSKGKDGVSGAYASYNTLDSFAKDYVRLLSLDAHGYPAVMSALKGGKTYEQITAAHNASKWSEDDYNVTTIVSRAKSMDGVIIADMPGKCPTPPKVCPTCQRAL